MSDKIFVIESAPSGMKSINHAISWMDNVAKKIDDASDFWRGLTPDIKQSIKNEFSEENPNRWMRISRSWKSWKIKHGYPATIGVRTGALRAATSDQAKIVYQRTFMQWDINPDISSGEWGNTRELGQENVGEYADSFHRVRRIFVRTLEFLQESTRAAVRKFVKDITRLS